MNAGEDYASLPSPPTGGMRWIGTGEVGEDFDERSRVIALLEDYWRWWGRVFSGAEAEFPLFGFLVGFVYPVGLFCQEFMVVCRAWQSCRPALCGYERKQGVYIFFFSGKLFLNVFAFHNCLFCVIIVQFPVVR